MEVFAGFGEYADTEIGRLIEAIEATGQLDNTLDLLHRRRQRGERRRRHERALQRDDLLQRQFTRPSQDILKHYDELGGPTTYPHYAAGWAVAGDTPFAWTKQVGPELRRHPQRDGDPLAQGHHGEGRGALAVAPRHRHRADDPRSGRPARAEERERNAADARSKA